ncbi:MAG: hypothetical protein IRZ09_02420 [Variibacter sp.]|nr:hypothetical protein [Variibacter sp.]
MKRLMRAALLICLPWVLFAMPALADEPPSMRFEWVREGPADVCGDACREWVVARGPITKETVRDFEFFTEVKSPRGATLVLDSGGGSVLASLELGRKVRALGMTTTVGRIIKLDTPASEEQRGRFSPRGECASMCVFVLLGGVKRIVPPEARVLVHQIWPGDKRYDASAESYTAEELVRVQRDAGRIARYTVEMGGGIELFELAMRIPPWERLRALSQSELRRVGLQTVEAGELPTSGVTRPVIGGRSLTAAAPERGWTVLGTGEQREVVRRHPLTVEGEEIGQFELSVSCAPGGAYRLAYLESRAQGTEKENWVQDVVVQLGDERAVLDIASSSPNAETNALDTRAAGRVSSTFVEALRKESGSALVVATRASDGLRTSTQVGGTGFAEAFQHLAAACAK